MPKQKDYKKTLIACYLGFVTQAISANFTPLLFLTFKDAYGITLDKIAMIPLVFYLTQLLIDFAATKYTNHATEIVLHAQNYDIVFAIGPAGTGKTETDFERNCR